MLRPPEKRAPVMIDAAASRRLRTQSLLATALAALLCTSSARTEVGSRCFGTPGNGRIEHAVSLPLHGRNFTAYSALGWFLGRAHVHRKVSNTLLQAFGELERTTPGVTFVYGETGWPSGGRFRPHRTHQNGTSVDLMVPVRRHGAPVVLPGGLHNRLGYDIEFDRDGRSGDDRIDFEALGTLLREVDRAARANGIGITRVIFDVPLQRHLWRTSHGAWLRDNVAFSQRPAWVRHDEHVHIDFALHCAGM